MPLQFFLDIPFFSLCLSVGASILTTCQPFLGMWDGWAFSACKLSACLLFHRLWTAVARRSVTKSAHLDWLTKTHQSPPCPCPLAKQCCHFHTAKIPVLEELTTAVSLVLYRPQSNTWVRAAGLSHLTPSWVPIPQLSLPRPLKCHSLQLTHTTALAKKQGEERNCSTHLFLSSAFAVQTATFSTKMLSPVTQGRSVTPSCCCTTFSVAATATDSNPLDFDAIKP